MIGHIYPPRIETKLPPSSLDSFDKMNKFMAQVKLNGSSMQLYIEGDEVRTFNRRKEIMKHKMDKTEFLQLNPHSRPMVLCGEYMNKNKSDETGRPWNLKYVIWDILVLDGENLIGKTFDERFALLEDLYGNNPTKKLLHQVTDNCFRVGRVDNDFEKVYNDIVQWDMYEGLCLKTRTAKLERGTTQNNNTRSQFKCRKKTKNYSF